MSRPAALSRRALRASLAPALFAAAITGCADSSSTTAPATAPPMAVPMASASAAGAAAAAPRLLRGGTMPAIPAATPALSAIAHARALAPQWGATGGLADLVPIAIQPITGGDIVRMRQLVDGVPVDRGELRVLVGQGGTLLAASGIAIPADAPRDRTGFASGVVRDGGAAVARAVAAVHGVTVAPGALAAMASKRTAAIDPIDPSTWVAGVVPAVAGDVHVTEARARRAWFQATGALAPAWVVEAYTSVGDSTDARLHRVVVAARDGRVLAQKDLTVDAAFDYRVWADTSGDKRPHDGPLDSSPHATGAPGAARPPFVAPNLVSVDGLNRNPDGGSDPWLTAGATTTTGNNVDAYTDINSPNGFGGADFRAAITSAGVFDRVYDTAQGPLVSQDQQMAAITQLFYSINWLHDSWYDAGFTEAAGNGQLVNYGRGGEEGDPLRAEAQDAANQGRRNNANMSTPSDGMNPVMQVFLWTGNNEQTLTLSSTATAPVASGAAFGPGSFDLSGTVVAALDGMGASMTDGCEPITNNVTGMIVLLDRGTCTMKSKVLRAQQAGAIGVLLANNTGTNPPNITNDTAITTPITIPTMGMSMAAGAALRTALAGDPVTTTMHRVLGTESDGSLDGGLVAHEFGHYLHHRLSTCDTKMCGGMSEGWADFLALHMMARPGDNLHGTYSVSAYAFAGDQYFGIRRAPYSVDTARNAFTFNLVADGQPLPTSHPTQANGGPNSEVHNAGEVWAEALWEVYVALQEMPGAQFQATKDKMARYIVAGLSMAPPNGTFTEIRDSILAAVLAASPADHDVMAAAFARRGLGTCAKSPPRESDDNIGAEEAFTVSARALPGTAVVTLTADCDADGALDVGDTATISVPIANAGALALTGGARATATSNTPGLVVPSEAVTLAAIAPYGMAMATFDIAVTDDAGPGPTAGSINVTVTADGCTPTSTLLVPVRVQVDTSTATSASDSFDAVPSAWAPTGEGAATLWNQVVEQGLDRQWIGTDSGTTTDVSLESPELVAGDAAAVVVTFDHVFDFEFSSDTYFDGGLIEITTDGGTTWNDVSMFVSPGYNGTLGGDSGNPLDGRMAFGSTNPSYPSADRVTLDFGAQLAGQTFKLRFRIATDAGVGAPGWKIDDLAVTGITNTPFPSQAGEDGICGPGPDGGTGPGDEEGGCCSTGGGARPGDIAFALLTLGFVLVRRRRPRSS